MPMSEAASWLRDEVKSLTSKVNAISPAEWAEKYRRLPSSVTERPGPYDYGVTPYLRDIVECLDRRSPVRRVAIMKGAQTGGTVGVLENFIGYAIGHIRTWPMLLVTATQPLAQIRMEEYIEPMIEQSGLADRIQSNTDNARKSGKTARKMSWAGGGFLIPTGSNEAANLRSVSMCAVLLDELDSYPIRVGRDGDAVDLAISRTKAFENKHKIVMISTPTTTEESKILREYEAGDQCKYMVPCKGCGERQEIKWEHKDAQGNRQGGIVWSLDEAGRVVPGSVRYACKFCGECHINSDKKAMLAGGVWVATAIPVHPSYRSFHISGLMSPPGFYSWESAVVDWLKVWNVHTNQPRSKEKLQVFYNNVLGVDFTMGGSKLSLAKVGMHVRDYSGQIVPNAVAQPLCGAKISFLTCAADIHKDFISAAVYAWGRGRVGFLVGQFRFDGNTGDVFAKEGPWAELSDLIDRKFSDGIDREYSIKTTLVDSNYMQTECYAFCSQYRSGVYPIRGDTRPIKGPNPEFKKIENISVAGVTGWHVQVNLYKSAIAAVLKAKPTDSDKEAPIGTVSFPKDLSDESLNELVAERFLEEEDKNGNPQWVWRRIHARNELWDLTVYNSAARDIVAWMICRETLELDQIVWGEFWKKIDSIKFGWAEVTPIAR